MENESFENKEIAGILNENFVSIKLDKEERPDVDSVYMRVCQAYTGSGGWPTSIFMSADQKPFFAGTYFPPKNFENLLNQILRHWKKDRQKLTKSSDEMIKYLNAETTKHHIPEFDTLTENAFLTFKRMFDTEYGGFGRAPKFPSPHNLMFLLGYHEQTNKQSEVTALEALDMSEKTLIQMFKGGIFDHIGYGFSRYSTDKMWLAPHFEKMLYDNALLATTYILAYEITENVLYKEITDKIFEYIEREMTDHKGGLYSAQDADSDGVEGKYYVFNPDEIIKILGEEDGKKFCNYYDITEKGNFEGESIPNIIRQKPPFIDMSKFMPKIYEYRKNRTCLHKDNKILTAWNSLMIWAYANAYRVFKDERYLKRAENAASFIENNLIKDDVIHVAITDGKLSGTGYLDDYAFYTMALISLYEACFNEIYLERALEVNGKIVEQFLDHEDNGFYLYGKDSEKLIARPKESYDGAIPSGNSVMAYNLDRLYKLTKDKGLYTLSQNQNSFMDGEASSHPGNNSFYMYSSLPTKDIVCVLKDADDLHKLKVKHNWVVKVLNKPTEEYKLLDDKTTFYVCEGDRCLPPVNAL
ncbi:MAG: thioredoxin domain-containing protein [Defluviitaleaceae bacterium]|nr:thioredoxin domain-containing protein [Defluviitaleaceae bacterium]